MSKERGGRGRLSKYLINPVAGGLLFANAIDLTGGTGRNFVRGIEQVIDVSLTGQSNRVSEILVSSALAVGILVFPALTEKISGGRGGRGRRQQIHDSYSGQPREIGPLFGGPYHGA